MTSEPIVVEETYSASITEVWKAITDPDQMRSWFFDAIPDFKPEVGFSTEFDVENDGVTYPHRWKLTEVAPEKKIVYDWHYEGIPGQSTVTWELLETDEGTKLTITHAGGETFPQDNPIFSREAGIAGWSYFLQESLKDYLAANRAE